jgi:hypothetical protein
MIIFKIKEKNPKIKLKIPTKNKIKFAFSCSIPKTLALNIVALITNKKKQSMLNIIIPKLNKIP